MTALPQNNVRAFPAALSIPSLFRVPHHHSKPYLQLLGATPRIL